MLSHWDFDSFECKEVLVIVQVISSANISLLKEREPGRGREERRRRGREGGEEREGKRGRGREGGEEREGKRGRGREGGEEREGWEMLNLTFVLNLVSASMHLLK